MPIGGRESPIADLNSASDATAWNAGLQTGTAVLRTAHVVTLKSGDDC